jgi:hypothetical protein
LQRWLQIIGKLCKFIRSLKRFHLNIAQMITVSTKDHSSVCSTLLHYIMEFHSILYEYMDVWSLWVKGRDYTSINTYKIILLSYLRGTIILFIKLHLTRMKLSKCRGSDRMVVGFTTTYAISAYHHWCCEFESRSGRGVQHYVIRFDSDLRQVGGFLQVLPFPLPKKLTATI